MFVLSMRNWFLIPPFAKGLVPPRLSIHPESQTDYDGHKLDHIASITQDSLLRQSQHQIFF